MNDLKRLLKNAGILMEGTWSVPNTEQRAKRIAELLSKPLPAADAERVLYHVMGDDVLFDGISELKAENPDADTRHLVVELLREWLRTVYSGAWRTPWSTEAVAILKQAISDYDNNKDLTEDTLPLNMDHATFIVQACRDWLDRKNALEKFKTTGHYKNDFAEVERIQEEMAHIRGYLEEHMHMHGYRTVNDMFQAAKKYILAHRNKNEAAGVGLIVPGVNTTADVGPNSLKKNAAKFGNKVTKGGIPPLVSKNSFQK